jgi:hypothetical protein
VPQFHQPASHSRCWTRVGGASSAHRLF